MAHVIHLPARTPERERLDLERLVNEGGPDPVTRQEIAQRAEVWKEALEQHGGTESVVAVLDKESAGRLRQMAREQGVTFETLIGTVLLKYSHDQLAERRFENQSPSSS